MAGSTHKALQALENRNIPVIAATGRSVRGGRDLMAQNNINLPAAVFLNGALGIDLATDKRFHSQTFGIPKTLEVIEAFISTGIQPCTYIETDLASVVTSRTASTSKKYLDWLDHRLVYVDDLLHFFQTEDAFSVQAIGVKKELLEPLVQPLSAIADISFMREQNWGNWTLSAVPPSISKWSGVESYCNVYGLPLDSVLAIGDADNDLDLLRKAAVSLAMPLSTPAVLGTAKYVVDEWADVLKFLG